MYSFTSLAGDMPRRSSLQGLPYPATIAAHGHRQEALAAAQLEAEGFAFAYCNRVLRAHQHPRNYIGWLQEEE